MKKLQLTTSFNFTQDVFVNNIGVSKMLKMEKLNLIDGNRSRTNCICS